MRTRCVNFLVALLLLLLIPVAAHAAAPVVLYTDIVSGPSSGGENNNGSYLSIFGKNFGNNIANVKVYIGNGEVARYMYLGSSFGRPDIQQISVQVGPAIATGAIKVVVENIPSNLNHSFTVRPGNFYFVSPTGSNSTGKVNDISSPYRTANYVMALSSLGAGDFIVVRGGTFNISSGSEDLYFNRWLNLGVGLGGTVKSGTSLTNNITVYGFPGEVPVVDFGTITSGANSGIRAVHGLQYYTLANLYFNLRNSGGNAIYLGFYSDPKAYCNYCRVVNIRVSGGMAGATSGVNAVLFHRVDNFKLYGLNIGNQSPMAAPTLASHVVYLSHFYDNADLGWNYIHDNTYGRAALQVAGDAWGSDLSAAWGVNSNVRIHDSLFENLPQEAILFNLGSKEIYVYNNVIKNVVTKNNAFAAIAFRGAALNGGDYYFYNNSIYTDALGGSTNNGIIQMGYLPQGTYPRSITMYNNIIYSKSTNSNYYSNNHSSFTFNKVTSDSNIWYGSTQSLPFAGPKEIFADPKFVNLPAGNLHLADGSPAKSAGNMSAPVLSTVTTDYDANTRFVVPGYDIGAYKFVTSDILAPKSPSSLTGTKKR